MLVFPLPVRRRRSIYLSPPPFFCEIYFPPFSLFFFAIGEVNGSPGDRPTFFNAAKN